MGGVLGPAADDCSTDRRRSKDSSDFLLHNKQS